MKTPPWLPGKGMKNSNKSLIISGVKNARRSQKKVTWAASLGDRSENADYQYNKKASA